MTRHLNVKFDSKYVTTNMLQLAISKESRLHVSTVIYSHLQ